MSVDELWPVLGEHGDEVLRRPTRSWPGDAPANHPHSPTTDPDDLRDPNAVGLGRYLCAGRLAMDLSYDEAARRSGVDRVMIIALERGLFRPARIQPRWLAQLARLYDYELDDLLLLLGAPQAQPEPPAAERAAVRRAHSSGWGFNARQVTTITTYLGTGHRGGPEQVRVARPFRELDRQFMDK